MARPRYRRTMATDSKPESSREKVEPALSGRDEPVKIDLDPEVALRALLKVDPDSASVKTGTDKRSAEKPSKGSDKPQ